MEKAITIGLIGLMIFFGIQNNKQKQIQGIIDLKEQEIEEYLSFSGTIEEIRSEKNYFSVLVQQKEGGENSMVFHIAENVTLLSASKRDFLTKETLQVGDEITAYYRENTPMTLSLPPQLTPQLLITDFGNQTGFIHMAVFDHTLTSNDGQLKINLSTNTVITDSQGQPATKLTGKALVVFYTTSTRSIPAQTSPQRIVVLY